MRSVRVALPLAIMLGLAGSTSAFLQSVRPSHLIVPAHKYQAAVSRVGRASSHPYRAARSMRVMSATVDVETTDPTSTISDEVAAEVAAEVADIDPSAGPAVPATEDVLSGMEVRRGRDELTMDSARVSWVAYLSEERRCVCVVLEFWPRACFMRHADRETCVVFCGNIDLTYTCGCLDGWRAI